MKPRLSFLLPVIGALLLFSWIAGVGNSVTNALDLRPEPGPLDYYGQLTQGFLKGHLYLPVEVVENAKGLEPFMMDASYWNHHYYLYFGALPVVLVDLPVRLLTGKFIQPEGVVLILVACGFLFQAGTYCAARRRYFPALGPWSEAPLVLFLAFAPLTPLLCTDGGFYQEAVASAYCALSIAWAALFRALHEPTARVRGFAWASLWAGLAVAGRPTTLLALPALAGAAWWAGRALGTRREKLALALATLVPAAVVGLMIMAYNQARFGSPLDFGLLHQANAMVGGHFVVMSARYVLANLRWYYFSAPNLSPYFPYFQSLDVSHHPEGYYGFESLVGQVQMVALLGLVALFGWMRLRRLASESAALAVYLAVLAAAFLAILALSLTFGFRTDRYQVDFQATGVLALALAIGVLLPRLSFRKRGLVLAMVLCCAAVPVLYVFSSSVRASVRHGKTFTQISRLGNYPAWWAAKLGLMHYGPHLLKVCFPKAGFAPVETLLFTGGSADADELRVSRLGDTATFAIAHGQAEPVWSRRVPIEPGRTYELEVDMGSFYPPRAHPFFDGWAVDDIERVKGLAHVSLDGHELIKARLPFYDTAPGAIAPGGEPGGVRPGFSGKILAFSRLPMRDLRNDPLFVERGVWRAEVLYGAWVGTTEPILSCGKAGAGNEIYFRIVDESSIQFALDTWGASLTVAPALRTPSSVRHRLEVFAGAQVLARRPDLAAVLPEEKRKLVGRTVAVWWDGVLVWTVQPSAYLDQFGNVGFGSNSQGFSSTPQTFNGLFEASGYTDAEADEFIARNLAALDPDKQPGSP